jgi:hypothetical protein
MEARKCPVILSDYQPYGLDTIAQQTGDDRTIEICPLGHQSYLGAAFAPIETENSPPTEIPGRLGHSRRTPDSK